MTYLSKQMVLALLVVLIFTGSAQAGELRFWTSETSKERLAVISYLVDLFDIMNDDVTVKFESVHEDEILNRLSNTPDEQMPAVIQSVGNVLSILGVSGYLDDQASSRLVNLLGRDQFYDGALAMLVSPNGDDLVWAVPLHGWVQGIWYRKDMFEAAGLKPPSDWAAIEAAAEALTDPKKGQYGILLGTGADLYAEQTFHHIAMSNGVSLFDEQGELAFDSPKTVAALELMVRLSRYAPEDATGWRGRDYYFQNKLGMMFYSTYIMDDFALPSIAANSLGTQNFPALKGADFDPALVKNSGFQDTIFKSQAAVFGQVSGLSVSQNLSDEQKEIAERFIRFVFEPATYIAWLHMAPGGMMPVRRGVAQSEDFLRDPQRVFIRYGRQKVAEINAGLEKVSSLNALKGKQARIAAEITQAGILRRMIHRAVHENIPAQDAVKQAVLEMQGYLE